MTTAPSKWMEVTLPWTMETKPDGIPEEPHLNSQAHPRRSMCAAHSEDQPVTTTKQATATVGALPTPPWEFMLHQPLSESQPLCPPPRFMEIAQTLRQEEPMESGLLQVIITGILTEGAIDPYKVIGTTIVATKLLQNQTMGDMLVTIQVCSEGIVGLGLKPVVDKCPVLTLQELSDSDS